jgi:hypothetical protein
MRALVLLVALAACATHVRPVSPDSPLAKIQKGMGIKEVIDLLGPPTDQHTHITGKVFAPFYFGDDAAETDFLYKGLGRVTFSGGAFFAPAVMEVEEDPNEPGYYRR